MARYIYQQKQWPEFVWDWDAVYGLLSSVRHKQGRLKGNMEALGFVLRDETKLQSLTLDVLKSSEIEGENLDREQVRSSVARQLGMDVAGLVPSDRNVDGVVEMMLDATQNFKKKLTKKRLCGWHASLFPTGYSGSHKIAVGKFRDNEKGPMQVVSGAMGKERVHFEAPSADRLEKDMEIFLFFFNAPPVMDPVLLSAVMHLWFVTLHPFDDGNGRIARAVADMVLTRGDGDSHRFYSMSAQIRLERKGYYEVLERTQRGTMDVTEWMLWYLRCFDSALNVTDSKLQNVLRKTKFWDAHANTSINERQRLMINKLFDGFEGNLNSSKWAKMTKCSADTALRDIQDLMDKSVLEKGTSGGRSTNYVLKF